MENKNSYVTLTMSLYKEKGKIITSHECKVSDKIEYNNVTIKEYPELKVETDGSITFPTVNKYKGRENIHINGTITILEPIYVSKYVRIYHKNVYIKRHYKEMITGIMMYAYVTKSYIYKESRYTQEEYDTLNENDCLKSHNNDHDDVFYDIIVEKEQIKTILDEDENFYNNLTEIENDPNVYIEYFFEGYKLKNTIELENELVSYEKEVKTFVIHDFLHDFKFVKSILIKTECKGVCELSINNYKVAIIPFKKQFDLTSNNDHLLNKFHEESKIEDVDGFCTYRFRNIELKFNQLIDDFDVVIEKVNNFY